MKMSNTQQKASKPLVKINATNSAQTPPRSSIAAVKPARTTSDVVIVTQQVAETKREIENLKAELQKLIDNGKNVSTNNALNVKNNVIKSPAKHDTKDALKGTINNLTAREKYSNFSSAVENNRVSHVVPKHSKATLPSNDKSNVTDVTNRIGCSNEPYVDRKHDAGHSTQRQKKHEQLHDEDVTKTQAGVDSIPKTNERRSNDVARSVNRVTRRKSLSCSNDSPKAVPASRKRSHSYDKEMASPQRQHHYNPKAMKDYIKKQRQQRSVRHKEEIAEKKKLEEERKTKLQELQQKTDRIFFKNVNSAHRTKKKMPSNCGDCVENAGNGRGDLRREETVRRKPVSVDGVLAQSDELFISTLRKPHISRSLQKELGPALNRVCSRANSREGRDKSQSKVDLNKRTNADVKFQKLSAPKAILLKNVETIRKKRNELEKNVAATKIQAVYKGYKQRKVFKNLLTIKQKEKKEAKRLLSNGKKNDADVLQRLNSGDVSKDVKSNIFVNSDDSSNRLPKWLQPAATLPYPYNFITAVKRKLSLAVNNITTIDCETQCSRNVSVVEDANEKLRVDRSVVLNDEPPVLDINRRVSERKCTDSDRQANDKKSIDLKSFLSQKCLNLDLKTIEPLTLTSRNNMNNCENDKNAEFQRPCINETLNVSQSESDTSKHITDISEEHGKPMTRSFEDDFDIKTEKLNYLPSSKVLNQNFDNTMHAFKTLSVEPLDTSGKVDEAAVQNSFSINVFNETGGKANNYENSVDKSNKRNVSTVPIDNICFRPLTDNSFTLQVDKPKSVFNSSDVLNRSVETTSREKNPSVVINRWNSVAKNPQSISFNQHASFALAGAKNKLNIDSEAEKENVDEDVSSKDDNSFKSLNTETESDSNTISIATSCKTANSSVYQMNTINSRYPSVTYRDSRTIKVTEENKYSSDFIATSANTNPSILPSLSHPSISLQSSRLGTDNFDSQKISMRENSNFQTNCQSNQIHLKFETELHLLDSMNESLNEVVSVEKSLLELQNKNTMHQNKDTQTVVMKQSDTPRRSANKSHTSINNIKQIPSINYSRGSIVSEDLSLTLDNISALNDTLNNSEIDLSHANETALSTNTSVDGSSKIYPLAFAQIPEPFYSGLSLGMYDQLIKEEDARIDNLKQMCKLGQQALNDRTKGELAWLEFQKKLLKDKGQTHEASLVKKKQRGLLIKLQNEKHELHRIRQMNKAASLERKTILKEQRNLIKAQLSSTTNMIPKIRKSTCSMEKRNSGPIKVYKNRTDSIKTAIYSRRSSISEETVSTAHSTTTKMSENIDIELKCVGDNSENENPNGKSTIQMDYVKRSLLMREAALQKRRKVAEDILQWHRRLANEETEISELENAANAIIAQSPKNTNKVLDSKIETYYFNGAQLNLIWQNMTGREENKFDYRKKYSMSKIALERFCQDAKKNALYKGKNSTKQQNRVSKTDTENVLSDGKEIDDKDVETSTRNNVQNYDSSIMYASDFEQDVTEEHIKSIDNSIQVNSMLVDNNSIKNESLIATEDDSVTDIRNSVFDSFKSEIADSLSKSQEDELMKFNSELALSEIGRGPIKIVQKVDDTSEVESIDTSVISTAENVVINKNEKDIAQDVKDANHDVTYFSINNKLQHETINTCSATETVLENVENDVRIDANRLVSDNSAEVLNSNSIATNVEGSVNSSIGNETSQIIDTLSEKTTARNETKTNAHDNSQCSSILEMPSNKDTNTSSINKKLSNDSISLKEDIAHTFSNMSTDANTYQSAIQEDLDILRKELERSLSANSKNTISSAINYSNHKSNTFSGVPSSQKEQNSVKTDVTSDAFSKNEHGDKTTAPPIDVQETKDEINTDISAVESLATVNIVNTENVAADDELEKSEIAQSWSELLKQAEDMENDGTSEFCDEYLSTQENSSPTKSSIKSENEGVTHIDIRKRVSEILADANTTTSRDNSPRLQDLYMTTYDVMSASEDNSPDIESPLETSTDKSVIATEIFGDEAEELLRKQLAIEKEIKELEKQQKEQIPYLFVREIPNKPPPPYTPPTPVTASSVTSILPSTTHQINAIVSTAANSLHRAYCTGNLENCNLEHEAASIDDVNEECCQFIFDLCKEVAVDHYKPFRVESGPSWMKVENKYSTVSMQKPFDRNELENYLSKQIKQFVLMDNGQRNEKTVVKWSNKKRDHVDELLVLESQSEEAEWTNYDQDELIVKNEVTNDIFNMLLTETADVVNQILLQKSYIF